MQLLAVYVAMQAFDIDAPLPAAGLVLVLMNVATIFPLWPGNIGLVQAAVALPLLKYGVPYATGFAYGLALQALEMACGVGLGLIVLAREGLSFAMLRRMRGRGAVGRGRVEGVRGARRGARATRPPVRALLCPASLKGVLSARAAAAALARGVRAAGAGAIELPVADGGEGTAEALRAALGGEWREAIVSRPARAAGARRAGSLLPDGTGRRRGGRRDRAAAARAGRARSAARVEPRARRARARRARRRRRPSLVVALGGTATVDGGAGSCEVRARAAGPDRRALRRPDDARRGAAASSGRRRAPSPADVAELERGSPRREELRPYADAPGSGAAGGLGAALAALGAELVPGAADVLDLARLRRAPRRPRPRRHGRGRGRRRRRATGKAPARSRAGRAAAGVRCVVFGGRVRAEVAGPRRSRSRATRRARGDLVELGRRLAPWG